ncbi:GDP-mannose 4,6-dehydratase [Amycolatopsis australiensis]|uniref:GDP-mannose 4,6-dehydratase n=1 Tax=Amycolatopsis australiensis TaxID=546364 RepID=A0A1K1SVV4_9PSEU|nr:GDP-mannose 4,6-dehydratase [Amycolatopsis australiensis]SFW88473.1 GDPmannose 4,6-dehydratase [Amycolatopsis australiensis]
MTKRALITGITGQDGSYLAEHLLAEGYEVWGVIRGQANPHRSRIDRLLSEVKLVEGDLLDQSSLVKAVDLAQPDEVYNLAAISYVPLSWQQSELTGGVTGLGVLRMLEAIRMVSDFGGSRTPTGRQIRFYQASSSEMFGKVAETPQHERTIFHPRSPYGVAKTYGHFITKNYRESFGMFGVSGILFNHESPRRGTEFITRKITLAAARISLGQQAKLPLGNMDAKRDWGFAGDYVEAMRLMLQHEQPQDYVIGTGVMHSVKDVLTIAFDAVGLNWHDYVYLDPQLVRPAEVDTLCANAEKAEAELGWKPSVQFRELIEMMVEADLRRASRIRRDEDEPDQW